MDIYRNYRQYY